MKKLSEVCKIAGVTRRTLQEYDRIDLLKPTAKTEGGYWLYDDAAIDKLLSILVYVEAGYERKTIKSILETYTADMLLEEYDRVTKKLEMKRKKIDGMIKLIDCFKLILKLPERTIMALGNMDLNSLYQGKSISGYLNDTLLQLSEQKESAEEEDNEFLLVYLKLVAIASFMGNPVDDKAVQQAVKDACISMIEYALDDEEYSDISDDMWAELFLEILKELERELELIETIESQCGKGAMDYIVRAAKVYYDKLNESSSGNLEGVK